MFINKITEVKICVSLHEQTDVTFDENDAVAYSPCLRPHRTRQLTAILLKISKTNLKIMYIQKIEK